MQKNESLTLETSLDLSVIHLDGFIDTITLIDKAFTGWTARHARYTYELDNLSTCG